MKISGFLKTTVLDSIPNTVGAEVFTPGCNYNCPACHSGHIIEGEEQYSEEEVFGYLEFAKGIVDSFIVCGGEPTIRLGLKPFLREIKKRTGLPVKLDTNGSKYAVLQELLDEKLVDYVAMDVKGPLRLYKKIAGVEKIDERDDVMKGILTASHAPDYEFRTTIVPVIRNRDTELISFMTPDEIGETAKMIYDYTQDDSHKYFLQKFKVPREGEGNLLDTRLEKFPETPKDLLEQGLKKAREYLPHTKIRGEN